MNIGDWPLIHVYGTDDVLAHFDSDVRYMRRVVEMHSIKPGDVCNPPYQSKSDNAGAKE